MDKATQDVGVLQVGLSDQETLKAEGKARKAQSIPACVSVRWVVEHTI